MFDWFTHTEERGVLHNRKGNSGHVAMFFYWKSGCRL